MELIFMEKMKKLYFMLLVMFGIFLMPESSMACGKHSQKKSNSKEIVSHKHKSDSCDKSTVCKDNSHKNCKGKCGHSSCVCPASPVSVAVFFNQEFSNNVISSTEKKLKFYYAATDFASGFYSIWLRPKIS